MSEPKQALVTGGAGFIGSHLVERLLADGHRVVVLDNFSRGQLANLDHVKNNPRLAVHDVDVADYCQARSYFTGVQWVFHLAALADIVPSIEEPLKYHRSNVDGTVAVLEAARAAGVERFVYAASSSCYGLPDEIPTPETASIRPMYPYALTKISANSACCIGRKCMECPAWHCGCLTCLVPEPEPLAPTGRFLEFS